MKKQILNLMVAALFAVGSIAYTGCGGNPDDPNAPQTSPGDTNESLENPTEGGDVAPDPEKSGK